jgi:hypothetical protein
LSFSTGTSFFLLLLCPIIGLAYAVAFYLKDKRTQDLPLVLRWILSVLRFILVTLAVFLLLSPFIKTSINTIEKPIVIIAQDNSSSIREAKDSAYYLKELPGEWNKIEEELSKDFDVRVMSFGSDIKDTMDYRYNENETDISSLFSSISQRYSGKNLGAIILASDGIYNQGYNPSYPARSLKCAIYTVAMGDTVTKHDAAITEVEHNPTVYLGNTFPLQIVIDAQKLEGKNSTLTVNETDNGDKQLFTKPINYTSSSFHTRIPVVLNAESKGLKHYVVKITPVEGEENLKNNRMDVFIRVLDQKQHVLILSKPHPDAAAIAETINSTEEFDATSSLPDKFKGNLHDYCLIVLNQIPASGGSVGSDLIKTAIELNLPQLYVVGSISDLNQFNKLEAGIKIIPAGDKPSDAEPSYSNVFPLFVLSPEAIDYAGKLPALSSPFGTYQINPSVSVLMYQRINSVQTNYPLICFSSTGNFKRGFILGEGLFRWRIQDFADHKNNKIFNELILKTVQYLAIKEDKSFFRIHSADSYKENEPIEMDAELYNPSYQLINDPEVTIDITNAEGKKYSFTFSRTYNAYHLNAGEFQAGEYHYEARVKQGDKLLTKSGEFAVIPVQLESINTVADHRLLSSIATEHTGTMVYPHDINMLPALLKKREDIKPVIYSHVKFSPLIDLKILFFVMLLLISMEWALRKWNGIY